MKITHDKRHPSGTAPDLQTLRQVLARRFDAQQYAVFLFGSRASGRARRASDWDIGVWGPARVPGHLMSAAREDLESLRTLHSFDLVDLRTTTPEFRTVAFRHVVPLVGQAPASGTSE